MILSALTLAVLAQAWPAKPMPTVTMVDAAGVTRQIPTKRKATVLVFVATDCPIANRTAPELSRIVKRYAPKSVDFFFVYADSAPTNRQIQSHLAEFNLVAPGIRDAKHVLVKAVGAMVTPEAAVLNARGQLLYRGRINDLFVEHGVARKTAKTNDLRDALDQILAGMPVKNRETPALGCSIPPLD